MGYILNYYTAPTFKYDCSLGRNVILNKEMEAETGTIQPLEESSGWPDLRGPKPLGEGQRQLRKPGESGQPGWRGEAPLSHFGP